ncbi:hypothetical protein Hanom_Chr12g01132131 [Helianthus anomalus]
MVLLSRIFTSIHFSARAVFTHQHPLFLQSYLCKNPSSHFILRIKHKITTCKFGRRNRSEKESSVQPDACDEFATY